MQSFLTKSTIEMTYLLLKNIQKRRAGNIFDPIIFDFPGLKGNLSD